MYNEYVEPAYKVLSEKDFSDFTTAMVLYGTIGSYPPISPLAEAFLLQVKPLIDKYDRKYTKAKKGGALGGRPPLVTNEKIKIAIQHQRLSTIVELAEYFHCSTRTILRHIRKEEIEEELMKRQNVL